MYYFQRERNKCTHSCFSDLDIMSEETLDIICVSVKTLSRKMYIFYDVKMIKLLHSEGEDISESQ